MAGNPTVCPRRDMHIWRADPNRPDEVEINVWVSFLVCVRCGQTAKHYWDTGPFPEQVAE